MQDLLRQIQIRVNDNIYMKDPETSELGKRIIQESIGMIDDMGLEHFTFRKLAEKLGTTESSVYRYFENKHKLLIYLISWYWGWLEYVLVFNTANINNPEEQLKKAIMVLTEPIRDDDYFPHINTGKLDKIVINESSKAYLTKDVDQEKKMGLFVSYDRLCHRRARVWRRGKTGVDSRPLASRPVPASRHIPVRPARALWQRFVGPRHPGRRVAEVFTL